MAGLAAQTQGGANASTVRGLDDAPVFHPCEQGLIWISPNGEIKQLDAGEAGRRLQKSVPIVCHHKWAGARANIEISRCLDVMELFAFARPARFCLPTARGFATQMNLPIAAKGQDMAAVLPRGAVMLLDELKQLKDAARDEVVGIATMMGESGWPWGQIILWHLGIETKLGKEPTGRAASVWNRLPEYKDQYAPLKPGTIPVETEEARERLQQMLSVNAEARESQIDYTDTICAGFDTPAQDEGPSLVLAEAGTGTGKTVGYLAPATLWAEKNESTVWISTYTRTLQHQIASELTRFFTDAEEREKKVVIRKGRENYLCLNNLESALGGLPGAPHKGIALGLMARWAGATDDGDLGGQTFPAWLTDLVGAENTTRLADKRGECVHGSCLHYDRCFIEKSTRLARGADIVISNHALVMSHAARAEISAHADTRWKPSRYVFDEGHQVFDAADSSFSSFLSVLETVELRGWIRGTEERRGKKERGLKMRIGNLIAEDKNATSDLEAIIDAAGDLPAKGWRDRIRMGDPKGPAEWFFAVLRHTLYQRCEGDPETRYNLEAELFPVPPDLAEVAKPFAEILNKIAMPMTALSRRLASILDLNPNKHDLSNRARIEGSMRMLDMWNNGRIFEWRELLSNLQEEQKPGFIDWIELVKRMGEGVDVGIRRHWLDPSIPFAKAVLKNAHGVAITSATLCDPVPADHGEPGEIDVERSWMSAVAMTGAKHVESEPVRGSFDSPFDYARQTRILVVNDIDYNRPESTAGAMADLMRAGGGGGLGLFTAIQRLRAAHPTLRDKLADSGLPLYAQHVDSMNMQTLLQIFREEPHSCLLGTDAVRDGIDVPGEALRLLIFDRMPWPRQDMLFKARAKWVGRGAWTDRAARQRLRQAFGRLIRRATDKGVFVILDSRLPSRFETAFPKDVTVQRLGISEAIDITRAFLAEE